MTNLQKGLQRKIAAFTEAIQSEGGSILEVSKAAFCQARKKLKPTAFVELSQMVSEKFYQSDQVQRWGNYRLLAVDGSSVEPPNSKEIQRDSVFKYRLDGKAVCMAGTLMLYGTLNHMTLYGAMGKMEQSATLKKAVVSFRVTRRISSALQRLAGSLSKITEPIRGGRKFKRNHQPKRKYYMGYKPV